MKNKISIAKPHIDKNEVTMAMKCFKTTRISSNGEFINVFERNFSRYVNGGFSVAVSNGTTALQLALAVYKIGKGDEVIIPDYTYLAPMNAIIHSGAKPIIVDVDKNTWTINVEKIIELISKKTKAIMVVHTYGQIANMQAINKIGKKYKIKIIEDCAEALGAKYKNKMVGNLSDCSTFSFYGNKIITTGEGGMVVFKNKKFAKIARVLRNQGKSDRINFIGKLVGFNFRMTNIQAAIGISQLKKIKKLYYKRKEIYAKYDKIFSKFSKIKLPSNKKDFLPSYWMYTLVLQNKSKGFRDKVIKKMNNLGIEVRPGFKSLHLQPSYKKYINRKKKFTNSIYLSNKSLSFPTHYFLTDSDLNIITSTFKKIYKNLSNTKN